MLIANLPKSDTTEFITLVENSKFDNIGMSDAHRNYLYLDTQEMTAKTRIHACVCKDCLGGQKCTPLAELKEVLEKSSNPKKLSARGIRTLLR